MSSRAATSSPPTASSSSADLRPGTVVAGFRVERLIGHGARATVYEATQLSLDRRVALKLINDRSPAERVRRLTWPEHPGAVGLFGSGAGEHGPWLAMRLMPGATLATDRAPLDEVAAALAAAHAQGIVHGAVTARNVFVDGDRAYLSDFGLGPEEATAEDDRAALAELIRDRSPRPPRARPRRTVVLACVAVVAAAVAGAALLAGATDGPPDAPPAPSGTRSIGSDLAAGDVGSIDCTGRAPGGSSPACTISQRDLAGRPVIVPMDGTITSWAVRGARGGLILQVLRGRGSRLVEVDRSAEETISGPGPHVAKADLAVAAGDRVGLLVSPLTAVGVRRDRPRATTDRWIGPLLEPARPPERPAGTGLDRELLLRVDVSPKAGAEAIASLAGGRAARARAGRLVATRTVAVGRGEVRTVALVRLGGAVALDLLDGTRRLARAPVRAADGRGGLVALNARGDTVRVRWRNPDGARVDRAFAVTARGLS